MDEDDIGFGSAVATPGTALREAPWPGPPEQPPAPGPVSSVPTELRSLLESDDPRQREAAWDAFVARYSRLLLHVARLVMLDHDAAMDAYAHLLEQFRRDDFRTLRNYAVDDRSKFTTWLAVVARRACVDFHRHRYGRLRGEGRSPRADGERAARQRLVDLVVVPMELERIIDQWSEGPERRLRATELREALESALATIDPDDRLLLKLRFEDDLSAPVIASLLGFPSPFHVYRRLKALGDRLRRCLVSRGVESSAP